MKDTLRQIAVVITTLVMIIVNGLANGLPLNGLNTGEISDRFNVYFIPAGYVFSIWGLIYLGLIIFTVYQALPVQRQNARLRATGWWIALSSLANSAWIFLWHYEQFPLTVVVMLVLLGTLIYIYLKLNTDQNSRSTVESWAVRLPFSIYLGWITVATVANITALLDFWQWNRFGLAPEVWMVLILLAVLAIAVLMNFTRRDIAYALVILWALAGIALKHAAVSAVAVPTWIVFGLVAVTLAAALFLRLPARNLSAAKRAL